MIADLEAIVQPGISATIDMENCPWEYGDGTEELEARMLHNAAGMCDFTGWLVNPKMRPGDKATSLEALWQNVQVLIMEEVSVASATDSHTTPNQQCCSANAHGENAKGAKGKPYRDCGSLG